MKVRVLDNFKDKHTRKLHKTGDVINVTKKRYAEILTVGKLVEEVVEETEGKTEEVE